MTPHEFQQRHGVDAKRLRRYLRGRWPHQHNDQWHLNPTMVNDACAHFGIRPADSVSESSVGPTIRRCLATSAPVAVAPRSAGLHVAVQELALANGIPVELGRPVPWLTGQGHMNPAVEGAAPPKVLSALAVMHAELGGSAAALAAKGAGNPLVPDLVHSPTGCLIEVDEVQHFTSARLRSLALYPDVALGFDVAEYRSLIDRFRKLGDKAFAHRIAADFPQPGGRQAQRAYNDALRDLLAPTFTGRPVIRIPVPDRVIDSSTISQLRTALDRFT